MLAGEVDGVLPVSEDTFAQCHRHRSPAFVQPRATTRLAAEEPRSGGALTKALAEASRRKRRLRHWLSMAGRPECSEQLRQLELAIAGDPEVSWAAVALF